MFDENSSIQPNYLLNQQTNEVYSDKICDCEDEIEIVNTNDNITHNISDDVFGELSEIAEFGNFGKILNLKNYSNNNKLLNAIMKSIHTGYIGW